MATSELVPAPTVPQRQLGQGGDAVSALGVGTNRWRQGTNDGAVLETYQALLDGGVDFIDTAEVYGFGKSERLIGDCIRKDGRPVKVASKFAPFIARVTPRQLIGALDASLARLGLTSLDLYYVHFPFPFTPLETFAEGLVEAVKSGKARQVGVSNFSADQMRRIADMLGRSGVRLAANEVSYSVMNRKAETNGVLEACKELDVALVAYFPLASGRLAAPPVDGGAPDRAAVLRRTLARGGAGPPGQRQPGGAELAAGARSARHPDPRRVEGGACARERGGAGLAPHRRRVRGHRGGLGAAAELALSGHWACGSGPAGIAFVVRPGRTPPRASS